MAKLLFSKQYLLQNRDLLFYLQVQISSRKSGCLILSSAHWAGVWADEYVCFPWEELSRLGLRRFLDPSWSMLTEKHNEGKPAAQEYTKTSPKRARAKTNLNELESKRVSWVLILFSLRRDNNNNTRTR